MCFLAGYQILPSMADASSVEMTTLMTGAGQPDADLEPIPTSYESDNRHQKRVRKDPLPVQAPVWSRSRPLCTYPTEKLVLSHLRAPYGGPVSQYYYRARQRKYIQKRSGTVCVRTSSTYDV